MTDPVTLRRIPVISQARVVIDNDWAADPDGLVALAHHLLADAAEVRAVTCTSIPFGDIENETTDPAQWLARDLIERLGAGPAPVVAPDAQVRFSDLSGPSAGARVIVEESLVGDDRPLYVVCGGPLTNVASALALDPTVAERMTLVWIGGGGYPDGAREYNLTHDLPAAQFVFNESRARIIQVPQPAYRQCAMSVVELEVGLEAAGEFGAWLYDRFTAPPDFVRIAGIWPMGDSPSVLITALGVESSSSRIVEVPWIDVDGAYRAHPESRALEIYEQIDTRLLFSDFFARLQRHTREKVR